MNKHFPKRKAPTQTQANEAAENYTMLKAQRAFHVNLIANFERYVAELNAKVNAADTERLTLIEKREAAPGKIVECDRQIASLENMHSFTPQPKR